ncbi:hypothetical protein [Salinivibrio kushneri]|uniref:DUF5329 domain-containing protein n=1 Tax=Salinivibrio kushneri TaxID=1908198 RepID=A0AA47LSN6_9GAMM|nr:hypothetical protein [Salinivibrio kushneri]WBA10024.1 hypothetical protein N8M53_14520 [Salinivibrio kushneri]
MARAFFFFIIVFSALSYADTGDSPQSDKVITHKNENICKSTFSQEMISQQMTFSNQTNAQDVRRIAERKIAAARKKFADTGSYCDAAQVLMNFEPKSLSGQDGDAQFKEQ